MEAVDNLKQALGYWLSTPEPDEEEEDNIWSDFHIFDGEWVEVQNRMDWYESPNVPDIYEEHKYIFKQNMGMRRPEEKYFEQNVDNNEFASTMTSSEDLPSGSGTLRITTNIDADPPEGENDFCMVEYHVETHIRYEMPQGVTFLPRFISRPLNQFFKWAFLQYIGEETIERDGEYAIERTTEYFQYIRKYHGEEPIQTKSRQAEFKPMPEEGVFFQ